MTSETPTLSEDRVAELMVKVVDDVASAAEREELMVAAVADPELMRELESQRAFKATTDGWMSRLEADLLADRDRANPVRKVERGLGVALILFGFALLWGWGWVQLIFDDSVPLPVRGGVGAIFAGGLLLLFHVVRVRWLSGERDPYSEVIR